MKTEIAAEETKEMLREALEQKYGEVFDIGQIEVITKRPKNEPVQIGVIVDMTPRNVTKHNPVLSAVADK